MNRNTPLRRTGFKSRTKPPRPERQVEYTPRPRAVAVARHDGKARMAVPAPKFFYVRDERLQAMCRAMACQHCGRDGPDAGVTWAHSNWGVHGKGKGIKASDVFVAALCSICHRELDQGGTWTEAFKLAMWTMAHIKTVIEGVQRGLWPRDIPVPKLGA